MKLKRMFLVLVMKRILVDVPFTVPFNSITYEEFPVLPITDPDNWVDLENVIEDHFFV